MGDIDDFFAKKDKKKKGTKKFSKANTEVIAKNLIETDRKELKEQEKQDKELGNQYNEDKPLTAQNTQDDEEWDDYRENKKDYSGLKIESLTIEENPPEEEENETEINEDGEVVMKTKSESGPWNKMAGTGTNETQQDLMMKPEPEPIIQMPNVVGGSYKPPHMRGSSGQTMPPTEQRRPTSKRNNVAPDINNEIFFPSLSSAAEDSGPKGAWGKSRGDDVGFEEVKDRGQAYTRQTEAPRLTLGNKFAALDRM